MESLDISYEVINRVGVVEVSRPPVNAMRYRDIAELDEFLQDLPQNGELAVVFTSAGDDLFMAGHDVNDFTDWDPNEARSHTKTYMSLLYTVHRFPLPLIGAIDGAAAGAATILASLFDVRIASPDASFSIPEINVGIVGGYGPIRRHLPDGVARYMMYSGEAISAERAYNFGMVSVLSEEPVAEALAFAEEVASKSPDAVRAAKAVALEAQPNWPLEEYRREREIISELRKGDNAGEAASAFLEDREPNFNYSESK